MPIHIDDVIAHLKELRAKEGNLQICRVGHYGGIYDMSLHDIYPYNARHGIFGDGKKERVVHLAVPDIGPDPD